MTNSSGKFADQAFWEKLKDFAVHAGKEVVEKALTLYFAAQRPETPLWAKTVIYSALVYFVLPTDAIPDLTPFVGYADDLGTLAAALGAVAMCITPEVKQMAKQKVSDWFTDNDPVDTAASSQSANPRVIPID
ncbi:DUF1232 domain-containing protein [Oculatella sp. LEGE 06141]|uniref:YkvA family protein n=1 Tax=Oculatella sp. LEGE 06141 TaxID=1828648 RepID=UPI00187E4FF2|nr:YkvA family protein [Oculatella sp. LEGE 06141]MBE9180104.1 DUF1232 domain-containing protein [Oculatella sp. LEGE 06141]